MENKIRKGQVYKAKNSNFSVLISSQKGGKWKAKVLTEKPGVFNGTHTLAPLTLKKRFILVE